MAEQTPRRAECPACHKSVALRKDGMLWHHTGNEPEWPGSPFKAFCPRRGLPPEPDAPSKRRRRSQPDWADLREMARNAGWTRTTMSGQYGVIWWSRWKYLAPDERGLVSITYHSIEGWCFIIVNHPDDVSLQEPTPAKVLAAARLVGLGGAS